MKERILRALFFIILILHFSCNEIKEREKEKIISFFEEQYKKRKNNTEMYYYLLIVRSKEQPDVYSSEKEKKIFKRFIEKLDEKDPLLDEKERIFRLYNDFFVETKFDRRLTFESLDDFEDLEDQLVILKLKLDVMSAFYNYLDALINQSYYQSFGEIEKFAAKNPDIEIKLIENKDGSYSIFLANDEIIQVQSSRHVKVDKIENDKGEKVKLKYEIENSKGQFFISLDSLSEGKYRLKSDYFNNEKNKRLSIKLDTILDIN
ncbi:hypothetical protein [Aureivirga sp. CE67]|uniref:hypothetical protein n=1 Tax=Aureivirga sp. CE67 TaxID=1788983 RepID=UPI0018CAA965|nr:hypothetical protein [Aureivirga sp. CE67]